MQNIGDSGFIGSVVLARRAIKDMRDYVEYQKFTCRTLIDNADTQEFKKNTQNHENSIYRHIYNNVDSEQLTQAGKKRGV